MMLLKSCVRRSKEQGRKNRRKEVGKGEKERKKEGDSEVKGRE